MIPGCVGTWVRNRARGGGERPALVFRGQQVVYAELADRIDRLAAALIRRGVRPGARVAFLGNNHPAFVESLFATLLAGGIFVPLNTRLSPREIAYMLDDSQPQLLISTSPLEPLAVAAIHGRDISRIVVPDEEPGNPVTIGQDAENYHVAIAEPADSGEKPAMTFKDDALIVYTSGTTGRPKGAVLTHGNLTWNALNVIADYDIVTTDRALMISPLFHVASLGMGCLPILLKGATVLLEERFVAAEALQTIEEQRATTISGVPTTFQLMIEDPQWLERDITSLRLLTCGGSPISRSVAEAWESRGLAFSGGYGMTEAAPGITMLPPRYAHDHFGSAGLPHFFTDVRIAGTRESGVSGEIEARGPNIFRGYWNNPDATAAAFTDDGWLRTGDVGRFDADGFLTIEDRIKDMIISGGENIYSVEVEQAISEISGVTGVAVVGVPHERWGEVPHAVVTLADGAELDPERMVAELSTRLARFKVPRTLQVLDALPRTASGKVQKHLLRGWFTEQSEDK